MAGPLANVGTKVAGINFDVNRKLYWGKGLTMEFITINRLSLTGWNVEKTLSKGFDRVVQTDKTPDAGSDVIYRVADLDGTLGPILRIKELYIRVDSEIHRLITVPAVPPNGPAVFTLMCKIASTRANFDTTKK